MVRVRKQFDLNPIKLTPVVSTIIETRQWYNVGLILKAPRPALRTGPLFRGSFVSFVRPTLAVSGV